MPTILTDFEVLYWTPSSFDKLYYIFMDHAEELTKFPTARLSKHSSKQFFNMSEGSNQPFTSQHTKCTEKCSTTFN